MTVAHPLRQLPASPPGSTLRFNPDGCAYACHLPESIGIPLTPKGPVNLGYIVPMGNDCGLAKLVAIDRSLVDRVVYPVNDGVVIGKKYFAVFMFSHDPDDSAIRQIS
jgi:hypothetical protein